MDELADDLGVAEATVDEPPPKPPLYFAVAIHRLLPLWIDLEGDRRGWEGGGRGRHCSFFCAADHCRRHQELLTRE
ncbi:Os11g0446350 [Oryza sativa Japonica Group]|uniref:Os11g0446350 protein n=1 Tax=Oryza sativa subsp. japonica TaxID=39947 RepID=A0A0P0Y1U9_ORYSJ|nr:Os11g0446350 [Oryza sativa Japonica Group]